MSSVPSSIEASPVSRGLTKFPIASLKELFILSFPLVFTALITSLLTLCDRVFLSKYSIGGWNACNAAITLCCFFQITMMMIPLCAQAFIGHYKGANQEELIGPFTWQMIYFSLFSFILIIPMEIIAKFFFSGIAVQKDAFLYFHYLSAANFLYPLGATLASFFLGRGKIRIVFIPSVITQVVNGVLDYFLIFGVEGVIPSLGVEGAAIATIISQGIYCTILFILFLQKKYELRFNTNRREWNFPLFWEGLKTGIPRAFGRASIIASWIFCSHFLIHKEGNYQLTHTFGMTIFPVLTFMNEGMGQALIAIISHSIGANYHSTFVKIIKSAFIFLALAMLLLTIPLFFMQDYLISLFFKENLSITTLSLLKECCLWIWFACLMGGVNRIGMSLITASRDTTFYALVVLCLWITMCIPVYYGIGVLGWSPAKFFLIDAINSFVTGVIFILRFLRSPFRKFKLKASF